MTDALLLFFYIFLFPGLLFLFVYALFFEFIDRKIAARMQHRVGPPFFQPFADFIKMLGKEVINPNGIDQKVFDAAPLVALAAVITAYFYIPIVGNSPFNFQGDLVLVLFLLSVPTIVLLLLGWLSRNIFSAMGGIRAITQMFIYEVPFFLVLLAPAMMAGTWSVSGIVQWQQKNLWLVFLQPIGFVVALVCLQAKLERTPFDIPEAETEIVAGPWTELTGRRLAIMHLAKDIALVTGSALIAALFLGGPMSNSTLTPQWLNWFFGFFLFLTKTLVVLLILSSIKVATGRIRIDQLNMIGWKYIASAAMVQVALVLTMNFWWINV
jgi:NADH-quinone oxidoreductase subunit H